jgi:hypothetical protein
VNSVTAPSNLSNPSMGLLAYMEVEAGVQPLGLNDEIGISSFVYSLQGAELRAQERIGIDATKSTVSAEAVIVNIRCDTTFYSTTNQYPIDLDFMSASTDGTKSVQFRIYKNCTLTAPSWTTPYQYIVPVSYDTAGTKSSGTYLGGFSAAKVSNVQITLTAFHIHLNPGDTLTITAQSTANTDVDVSCSVKIH